MNSPPRVTIRDVARAAGVTISTVSNVLNHPERVSSATAERIRSTITELGYIRNSAARELRVGQTRMLGFILADSTVPFYWQLERVVEAVAEENDYSLLIGNSGWQQDRELRHLNTLRAHRASGVLATPATRDVAAFQVPSAQGLPTVLVDYPEPVHDTIVVSIDHHQAGRAVGNFMVESGRRRIVLLSQEAPRHYLVDLRNEGAESSIQAHPDAEVIWISVAGQEVAGTTVTNAILTMGQRPDAVFAPNDVIAAEVVGLLRRAGIRVPEDVAVVGYDDAAYPTALMPDLTTMRQDIKRIGRTAADLLLARIAGQETPAQVSFIPELIDRGTA